MPLKVSDGIGAWIKDFKKSDAPQFKGKSADERRDMALAAYLSAKRGDEKESVEEATSRADLARAMAAFQKRGGKVNESIADHEDAANAHQMAANSARQDSRAKKAHMSAASHHLDTIKHLNKGDRASAAMSHRAAKSQSKIARRFGNKISSSAHADTHAINASHDQAKDAKRSSEARIAAAAWKSSIKESVMWEAIDPKIQRVKMLARLGLVGKSDVNKLMMAMKAIDDGKELNKQYRNIIFDAFNDLIDLVTGDTTVFQKAKKAVAKEEVVAEGYSPREIKMAIGIASDKRYAGGNMTGAVKAIDKIKKGLSGHKQVMAVLKRQNEDVVLEGKMNQLHMYMKQKKSAKEIAKLMKLDVKTIAALIGENTIIEADDKDPGEYDEEGLMMKDQLDIIMDAADEIYDIVEDDENLPEWVQNKITKAADYIDSSRDYLMAKKKDR